MSFQADYITIVSGLPRSGTSMMMQMLEAGGVPILTDKLRTPDESNPRGYHEFEPVKKLKQDASWLAEALGKAVKVIHLLLMDLPAGHEYRVIFMRRAIEEVLASQQAMLARSGAKGANLPPDKLARIFQDQLARVQAHVAGRANFKMIDVAYADVVSDPGPTITAVNDLLDGQLDVEAMRRAVDPQLYRQRQG